MNQCKGAGQLSSPINGSKKTAKDKGDSSGEKKLKKSVKKAEGNS